MRLLHICSYYIGNKLYSNLFKEISTNEIQQEVYIPIRSKMLIGKNQIKSNTINFYYQNILNRSDRIFFTKKINKQVKDIEKLILAKDISFIHAHTLFSDGAAAYFLKKKYGIKYIVNVRNTDINYFWKFGLHLRTLMYEILLNADNIVFLSPAYRENTLALLPTNVSNLINSKSIVIPNGIDQFWLDAKSPNNIHLTKKDTIKILFIGTLNKNKNLESVLRACSLLKLGNWEIVLNVVGDGPLKKSLEKLTENLGLKNNVYFHGYINDQTEIMRIMDENHIFVMPSFTETFGLVYIEAMSKGLPVIYSNGQGIEGYFPNGKIGYSVNPENPKLIENAIKLIVENYNQMSKDCIVESEDFNWNRIMKKYVELYNKKQ